MLITEEHIWRAQYQIKGIVFYNAGINKYETTQKHGTIHAEVDALLRLPKQKKEKEINLAVLTTNKTGTILIKSRCCDNCIKSIDIISKKKNYKVKKIYYIDENGNLVTL